MASIVVTASAQTAAASDGLNRVCVPAECGPLHSHPALLSRIEREGIPAGVCARVLCDPFLNRWVDALVLELKLVSNPEPFQRHNVRFADGNGTLHVDAGCAFLDSDGYIWGLIYEGNEYPLHYVDETRSRLVQVLREYVLPSGIRIATMEGVKRSLKTMGSTQRIPGRAVQPLADQLVARAQSLLTKYEVHNARAVYADRSGNPFIYDAPIRLTLTPRERQLFHWYDF